METKRNRERDNDRVSKLPEFLIHQILSYLSPKEAARTTALSKTWLQSYYTFPILTFYDCFFVRSAESWRNSFFNFVYNTLLRYTRLNLRIQKLKIYVSRGVNHDEPYRLLDDSLGVAFDNGVQELDISVYATVKFSPYTLPSAMFDSPKLLTYLRVDRCKFPQNVASNSKCTSINFPFLQTLIMYHAYIDDEMLQKLLSSSPSLEKIVFDSVSGFKKFRVRNLEKLKSLDINSSNKIEIDIEDAPSLHLIKYRACSISFEGPCLLKVGSSLQSQNLNRLKLCSVNISDNSLKDLITNSPLLENLQIKGCDELERVYILSSSLQHLDFKRCNMLVEARIDAPNLLELRYHGKNMLFLSLNNTPDELKTSICINHFDLYRLNNAWIKQLRELLKAVNKARVKFEINSLNQDIDFGIFYDSRENPLPLEHQHQTENFFPHTINQSSSLFAVFVDALFSSSRPTTIEIPRLFNLNEVEFVKFLNNELMTATRNPNCCSRDQNKCWRHYLKDNKVEVYKYSQKEWQPLLQETSPSEFIFIGKSIRFRLEWYANLNAEV